jgi:hypothetical protein
MPKTLLAIVSAHCRDAWADTVRETWKPLVPPGTLDVLFFRGRGGNRAPLYDEVFLDCDDSYAGLPDKIRTITRWTLEHDYDFILKIDDDVIIDPFKLMSSGYEKYEYSGKANRPIRADRPFTVPYGFCYWMSRQCMKYVSEAELPEGNDDERWVATLLYDKGIQLVNVDSYRLHFKLIDRSNYPLYRPLCAKPQNIPSPDTPEMFAWCIHLSAPDDPHYSTEDKIFEMKKIFAEQVSKKEERDSKALEP